MASTSLGKIFHSTSAGNTLDTKDEETSTSLTILSDVIARSSQPDCIIKDAVQDACPTTGRPQLFDSPQNLLAALSSTTSLDDAYRCHLVAEASVSSPKSALQAHPKDLSTPITTEVGSSASSKAEPGPNKNSPKESNGGNEAGQCNEQGSVQCGLPTKNEAESDTSLQINNFGDETHNTRHKSTRRPVGYVPEPGANHDTASGRRRRPTHQRAKGSFPRECFVHTPSLKELQGQSFTDFVRDMVLPTANAYHHSNYGDDYDKLDRVHEYKPTKLTEGMAKITLPHGFRDLSQIGNDTTGRGPDWQTGTRLGDYTVSSPIEQNLLGLAGVYEYTFGEKPPLSMAAFREKADAYRTLQVGSAVAADMDTDTMNVLARKFWQKLSPMMAPAWYGADQEGTLFGDDAASGWSIAQLDSCIHVLSNLPGVTSPYLYAGMWGSVFCAHTEDMNLMSINYLHAGAPKIWYAIAPGPDAERFAALCSFSYSQQARACKEFMRHKRVLISPSVLDREGIRYTTAIQRPGDAIITFPGGYHFGFNAGFNVAEATNFGVPEWIPFGLRAKVCMCRPDSVRIDMNRLVFLLRLYAQAELKEPGLSWKVWADRRALRILKKHAAQKKEREALTKKKKSASLRKDFWVEVTLPPERKKRRKKSTKPDGAWRLAKPATRKMISKNVKVLLFLPAKVELGGKRKRQDAEDTCFDPDDVDEECFCGHVIKTMDNYVLVHLDGFPKSAEEWILSTSPKLFLDGGCWEKCHTKQAKQEIGVTHFWQEDDSKKLCTS